MASVKVYQRVVVLFPRKLYSLYVGLRSPHTYVHKRIYVQKQAEIYYNIINRRCAILHAVSRPYATIFASCLFCRCLLSSS